MPRKPKVTAADFDTAGRLKHRASRKLAAAGYRYCPACRTVLLLARFAPTGRPSHPLAGYCLDCMPQYQAAAHLRRTAS